MVLVGGGGEAVCTSPAALVTTPPWCEQAPLPPFDVVPSLHVTSAFVPPAAVAALPAAAPPAVAAPAALPAAPAAALAPLLATPPWCEHAPFPVVVDVVPSAQVTSVLAFVAVVLALVALVAAFVAAAPAAVTPAVALSAAVFATPPWCEQAPWPVVVEVVPSLHRMADACADATPARVAMATRAAPMEGANRNRIPPSRDNKKKRVSSSRRHARALIFRYAQVSTTAPAIATRML